MALRYQETEGGQLPLNIQSDGDLPSGQDRATDGEWIGWETCSLFLNIHWLKCKRSLQKSFPRWLWQPRSVTLALRRLKQGGHEFEGK
jgi:hypothetical protein